MAMSYHKTLSNPFFRFCRRFFVLLCLNFIFVFMTITSAFVLFASGIISLHTVCYQMVNDEDDHPFKTFFVEIKNQWSFAWRLEILIMSILLVSGAIYFGDYIYATKVAYDLFVWFSAIFVAVVLLVLLTLYFNFISYNNYINDDTFWMMLRKSAVITKKHIWHSLLMLLIFVSLVVVSYLVPYIIPFLPFSLSAILCETLNKKMYTKIALEEKERMTKEENLFLPSVELKD